MSENFHIPANFTDAGKLLGMFPIRNAVEAAALAVPLFFLCFSYMPFSLSINLIITLILVIPSGGFALIGFNDDSLTVFIRTWRYWRKNRCVMTYKGSARLRKRGEIYPV